MNSTFTRLAINWRAGKKGAKQVSLVAAILIASLPALLSGCSGGDAPAATKATPSSTPTTPTGTINNNIALSISQGSVKSDGSDFSTITATVSKDNILQTGVDVTFKTSCGLLSGDIQQTDTNGESVTTFKANPADQANQSCTITATSGNSSATIPVIVDGTTITLTADKATLPTDSIITLNISVKNASGVGIHNAPVSISKSSNILTGPATATTVNGNVGIILTAGSATGSCKITVSSMGATATLDFTVISATTSIIITTPATSPITIETSKPQAITVSGPEGTTVKFVTTLGTWNGGLTTENQTIIGGTATRTLTSTSVGLATVQVYDVNNPTNADSKFVYVTPPISEAAQIAISFSNSNVAPSTPTLINSVTVYAKVSTINNQPIANVPVNFSFPSQTGSYGTLSPATAITDNTGYAVTTFYAGTESSGGLGVLIRATEEGSGASYYDEDSIIIGGTPVSIGITRSTKAINGTPDTYIDLDMSVLVTDSKGAAMPDVEVSLSAWPTRYRLGYVSADPCEYIWQQIPGAIGVDPFAGAWTIPNEDVDKKLYYSAELDVGPCDDMMDCSKLVADGKLTPASAYGGVVPGIVKTGANGIGSFKLTYLKSSAFWIETQVTAKVKVMGTESVTTNTEWLPYIEGEECYMPDSPFGHWTP